MYRKEESLNDRGKMQTDLSHLPEAKQRELGEIVRVVRAHEEVEMIILFGSYARGDYKEERDLAPKRWSGHASDYDILVLVEDEARAADTARWSKVEDACNRAGLSALVRLICHPIDEVDKALEESRYFFLDIKREGRLLYDSALHELAEPRQLSPEEKRRIAQSDFESWFNRATRFYRHYQVDYDEGDLRGAMFNLNQAAESAYKAILLVFTGYCPHEHFLKHLGLSAERFGPVFEAIFPQRTREESERFTLLDKAYIGARYHKDFQVFWQEVEYLAPRVKQLLETTESLCRERIAAG